METVFLYQIFANHGMIKMELAHNAMMGMFLMKVNAQEEGNL